LRIDGGGAPAHVLFQIPELSFDYGALDARGNLGASRLLPAAINEFQQRRASLQTFF
jgi:hypothetical protein